MPDNTQALRKSATGGAPPPGRGRGYAIPPSLGAIVRDSFFEYTTPTPFTFTLGTETLQQAIPIQSDAHFICVMSMFTNSLVSSTGAATITAPVFTNGGGVIQITDASAQRFLSSAPIPFDTLLGTAQRPYVWPFTHLFRANGAIGVQVTGAGVGPPSMAGAVVRVVFSGFKVPLGSFPELGL